MKTPSNRKSWRWPILFGFYLLLTCTAHAQVNFVQITDPHIFDDIKEDGSQLDDKAALASFIDEMNQRVVEKAAEDGGTYDFVAVTGDFGIEQLIKGVDESQRGDKIKTAAVELASLIGLSKITTWLFVPGNNDLLDENPTTITYYYQFIQALGDALEKSPNKIQIIDLCAEGNSAGGQTASVKKILQIKNYAFIGFNDASFKNSDLNPDGSPRVGTPPVHINENFDIQMKNVDEVSRQVNENYQYVYIFYHIPEIDDPYFVTLNEQHDLLKTRSSSTNLIGSPYLYSSWFVKSDVRKEWNKIVANQKVKGLFAGHFHDYKKSTYQNFEWLRSHFYLSDTTEKLHVCPPLALKKQKGAEGQARGFQEVYIDANGEVSTRVFWFNQAGWNLSPEAAGVESASLTQLELGRTYEGLDRLNEAEAAYVKAAESNWPPVRQSAVASLKRIAAGQDSFLSKNITTPLNVAWGAGLTAVGTAIATAILTAVGLASIWVIFIPCRRRWKKKGRNRLKIGPITDSPKGGAGLRFEQVLLMVHGRLRTHFKPRNMVLGVPRLPMIATSQSAEVTELVESVAPGALGKYIAMVLKSKNQSQYSIEGVVQSHAVLSRYVFFISLRDNYDDKLLKHWHQDEGDHHVVHKERELAFDALKRLVRHMHK
jgi:hypothetical protein